MFSLGRSRRRYIGRWFATRYSFGELQRESGGTGVSPTPLAATAPPPPALPLPPDNGGYLGLLAPAAVFFPAPGEDDRVRVGTANCGSARGPAHKR